MNISKKALMSFLMALTSLIAMAQPYYHVMKQDGNNLTEEAMYDGGTYKIKIDMNKPKPKDAIGGEITIVSYDCDYSELKRSFYFTTKGNVYYNNSEGKFHFEESQLDYPTGKYSKDHCGHFRWQETIERCLDTGNKNFVPWAAVERTETFFYFANPENLPKLQEDLGNEKWAVLSACEWYYVLNTLAEGGWSVNHKRCILIDTTPGKSLLTPLRNKHLGETSDLSIEEFKLLEARGLVCLPLAGERNGTELWWREQCCFCWSCTPIKHAQYGGLVYSFGCGGSFLTPFAEGELDGNTVRLVVLVD